MAETFTVHDYARKNDLPLDVAKAEMRQMRIDGDVIVVGQADSGTSERRVTYRWATLEELRGK